jgi:hypothetical protein
MSLALEASLRDRRGPKFGDARFHEVSRAQEAGIRRLCQTHNGRTRSDGSEHGQGSSWRLRSRTSFPAAALRLRDAFRSLHGYELDACSWALRQKERVRRRRFDHVLACEELRTVSCVFAEPQARALLGRRPTS